MGSYFTANLQWIVMGLAALASGAYALTGFRREASEEDETTWAYKSGHAKRSLALGAILVALTATVAFTPRGYDGVVFDAGSGVQETELGAGINFVVPFWQHVTNINTQIQVFRHNDEKVFQHTLDTQEIRVPFAINYQITNPSFVYSEVAGGPETIIRPAALRAMRTIIGSYALEDVAPNQAAINVAIEDAIRPQLEAKGIRIDYVAIEDTIASKDFIGAIERERIAQRDILTAQHKVEIAQNDARAAVATAQGQADAMVAVATAEQQRQSLLSMSPLEFVWYTRWNGVVPQVMSGDGGGLILDLPELPATTTATTTTTTTIPAP